MVRELWAIDPFVKTVEYWERDKDDEVFDHLNPEVRGLVEESIRVEGGSKEG